MHKLFILTVAVTAAVSVTACGNLDYLKDPDYIACNEGPPLGRDQRIEATAPRSAMISGRPATCAMGPDGLIRMRKQTASAK
jgi:hypothetical protein